MALMRRTLLPIMALCALLACPNPEHGDLLGMRLMFQKEVLPNGLTLILVEDHSAPIVSYQTWVKVGSVDEHRGATGLAHLFEHLMFKGTAKYGPREFFQKLETRGSEVNAMTTRDYTVFYENFTSDLLDKVIDMESDRFRGLVLDDNVINTERMVVLEERRLRLENNPDAKMQEALWSQAYMLHPYAWPVIGDPRDIIQVPLATIRAFYDRYYVASNAVIVAVGDFDSASLKSKLRAAYGGLPKVDRPKREVFTEPPQKEERRYRLRDPSGGDRVAWAYHVTSARDDDSYSLDVLSNILFEGASSRMHRSLVEERKIAIGVSGTAFTPDSPGLFMMNAIARQGIGTEKIEEALGSVLSEIKEKGVTPEEVGIAVKQLSLQRVDSVRSAVGMGQFVGTLEVFFGDPSRFQRDINKYASVTPESVLEVARKYLFANNRTVVIMAPEVKVSR